MKIRSLLIAFVTHMGLSLLALLVFLISPVIQATAEPAHGIAMHGKPALPEDFKHMPYVNPDAPKGGRIVHGVMGTFDSVNPFILKSFRTNARGSHDPILGHLVFESLMFRSRDEPFTMYGLIAEKVEWPDDRKWIEFTLNPKAKWSDGKPITVEDVIFTFNLLAEKGLPRYASRAKKVAKVEKTGERKVRFTFNELADREFPMIIALTVVLPKHAIDPDTFDESTLEPMIGSGPYMMDKINPGKFITYKRNPNYWAKDLPSRVGFSNFDEVKIEYYRTQTGLFEAFKKGLFDVYPENDPSSWERNFDFPAVASGDITKAEFQSGNANKMFAFVFNTRKPVFKNRKVREALIQLFDFEWVNKNLFFGAYQRTASFWHGSNLSSFGIPASEAEKKLLGKYIDQVKPDVLSGSYKPPVSNGSGRDRKLLRKAGNLLKQAGYVMRDGKLYGKDGTPMAFEILTRGQRQEKLAVIYRRSLEKLGISVTIRNVDDAQYQRRTKKFDYDMVLQTYTASLSPGIEQLGRWGSISTDLEGSFNYAGANDPALDYLIDKILQAREREDFVTAVRAYDRMLISGDYLVPLYHLDQQWVAHRSYIKPPENTSLYGYRLETWWDTRAE
jgi:peptide/nickel transport system substrate-binding protein